MDTSILIGVVVRGPESVGDLLAAVLGRGPQEAVTTLLIAPTRRVASARLVALGTRFCAPVEPCDVYREAVRTGVACILLAHNHPSGSTTPTEADMVTTSRIKQAGELLGIELLDHIVVAGQGWRSLRESTHLWS